MPLSALPLAQLITQTQQDISTEAPARFAGPGVNETTLNATCVCTGRVCQHEHEHLAWISRQIIPTEADEARTPENPAHSGVSSDKNRLPALTDRYN